MKDLQLFDEQNPIDVKEAAIQHYYNVLKNDKLKEIEQSQSLTTMLYQPPPVGWLKQHPIIKVKKGDKYLPYTYLPIERVQLLLDKLFFGHWKTEGFKWERHFNEIIGTVQLTFLHPVTHEWITRSGAASIQIMQNKNSKISEFNETKKANALEMGHPKLLSECFKNAAKTIGPLFGRDVSRDANIIYVPLINEEVLKKTLS